MNNEDLDNIDFIELSVILPCQNEEQALGFCINQIKEILRQENVLAEIIVSDSSTDNSPMVAKQLGVKLIKHDHNGYGRAYLEAFKVVQGKYIFMADADGTYDFREIPKFLNYLKQGSDLVIGDRFKGKIDKGAMPWLHRYIGNPVLSFLFRVFFKAKINDVHCGMRAITKESLTKLNLRTTGMEFATEMIVRASQENLRIKQLPINYHLRKGKSKLKSFSDGWRHLRFMLTYAPDYLFLIPGILFLLAGIVLIWLLRSNIVYGCFLIILGYQTISLSVFTKVYMKSIGLIKNDKLVDYLAKVIKFETGVILGAILLLVPLLARRQDVFYFLVNNLGLASYNVIIISLTVSMIGIQTMFSAFLISILLIERK
tara:strand:- start:1160 stop:2275 length:1116 start_codon:yes stop_codon:yes gene_type:complete